MHALPPQTGARRLAAALSLTLALGGCAGVQLGGPADTVAQTTSVNYYPACYEPVRYLRESDDKMKSAVATGAVVRTIARTTDDLGPPVLDEQGTAAYVLRMNAINFRTQQLVRVDVASGAESVPRGQRISTSSPHSATSARSSP